MNQTDTSEPNASEPKTEAEKVAEFLRLANIGRVHISPKPSATGARSQRKTARPMTVPPLQAKSACTATIRFAMAITSGS